MVEYDTINYTNIPDALKERDHWICWKREERDGKTTKVPVNPRDGKGFASATDPDTWASFEKAKHYYEQKEDADGMGFVFSEEDTLVGVDLDDCVNPQTNETEDWARDIAETLNSYTEYSPSGTGLHVIVHGIIPEGGNRKGDVEMYDEKRFFTVTGQPTFGSTKEIKRRADALREVHNEYVNDEESTTEDVELDGVDAETNGQFENDLGMSLKEIREKDDKLDDLLSDLEPAGHGYPSPSEADLATASKLYFWRFDEHDIARIMRRHRGRDKIKERDDYLETTIGKAIGGEQYQQESTADGGTATASASTGTSESDDSERGAAEVLRNWLSWYREQDDKEMPSSGRISQKAAREIQDREHIVALEDTEELWAYNDEGIWKPNGEQKVREILNAGLGSKFSRRKMAEVIERLKALCMIDRDELGAPRRTIAVKNGLLDLETHDLEDLKPEHRAIVQIPVKYDPDAEGEKFHAFLEDVTRAEDRKALQEFVGHTLLRDELHLHRALMLVGDGANGKSTFLNVIEHLLGDENISEHSLQDLSMERFYRADLYGKLANINADLTARELHAGSKFKTLVGGDTIMADRKHEDPFKFRPTAKLMFAANQVPDTEIDDLAFYRRWLIIEFPFYIPRDERDPELVDKLTEDEELSGVLNWALDGLERLLSQSSFTGEDDLVDKEETWRQWGDSVGRFMSEWVEEEEDERISTAELHRAYSAFCTKADMDAVSQKKLTTEFKKADKGDYGNYKIDGKRQRGFKGIKITDDASSHYEVEDHDQDDRGGDSQGLDNY